MVAKYRLNNEYNGVEISFQSIPDVNVRTRLKSNGFRWHRTGKYWYAVINSRTLDLAKELTIGNERIVRSMEVENNTFLEKAVIPTTSSVVPKRGLKADKDVLDEKKKNNTIIICELAHSNPKSVYECIKKGEFRLGIPCLAVENGTVTINIMTSYAMLDVNINNHLITLSSEENEKIEMPIDVSVLIYKELLLPLIDEHYPSLINSGRKKKNNLCIYCGRRIPEIEQTCKDCRMMYIKKRRLGGEYPSSDPNAKGSNGYSYIAY